MESAPSSALSSPSRSQPYSSCSSHSSPPSPRSTLFSARPPGPCRALRLRPCRHRHGSGLIFGLIFVKRGGAFRVKNAERRLRGSCHRVLYSSVLPVSSARQQPPVFSHTGEEPAVQAGGNRNAQLAALIASGEPGGEQAIICFSPDRCPDGTSSFPSINAGCTGYSNESGCSR